MTSIDQNAAEFIAEAQEIIETFSRTLLELEAQSRGSGPEPDLINAAFRAIHSLKGLAGLFGAYFVFPHVRERVDGFLDPAAADSYQVDRSLEAFMNGGLTGTGPGQGTVKAVLPDAHSDFIFAVAGEEFGLLLCLLLVALIAFIVLRGFSRLLHENNLFALLSTSGFDLAVRIGPLDRKDADLALLAPAEREDATFDTSALDALFDASGGYPYFVQAYGKAAWDAAPRSPIAVADVRLAAPEAEAELAVGFFGSRFERATPAEREYLRAMAELTDGRDEAVGTAGIAEHLSRRASSLSPARDSLLKKGLVFSAQRGQIAFTVPHFGRYLLAQS